MRLSFHKLWLVATSCCDSLPTDKEFESYLKFGLFEHGFLRLKGESCQAEKLVAFSCVGGRSARFAVVAGWLRQRLDPAGGRAVPAAGNTEDSTRPCPRRHHNAAPGGGAFRAVECCGIDRNSNQSPTLALVSENATKNVGNEKAPASKRG